MDGVFYCAIIRKYMRTIGKLITADMPLGSLWRLNPEQEATLEKLHIATVHDLLRHYPSRY